jgi:hypothetical protein
MRLVKHPIGPYPLIAMVRPKRKGKASAASAPAPIVPPSIASANPLPTQDDVLPLIESSMPALQEISGNKLKRSRDINFDKDDDLYENTLSLKPTFTP